MTYVARQPASLKNDSTGGLSMSRVQGGRVKEPRIVARAVLPSDKRSSSWKGEEKLESLTPLQLTPTNGTRTYCTAKLES